ncbi:hypothetical protein Y032_0023g741 [Ancylostoma ceylanicum]|uniref:Uncharacterized protein n=1 Tax=Ancylostoma ceylanicum TaxID=53326 RepID=A0A016UZC6_9BILA|nr:hypothetical protein Y032_0023g741 [Ancylostoma ceylanicum]
MLQKLLFTVALASACAYNLGPPCLPQRVNYDVHYPCLERPGQEEYYDRMRLLRGEPSSFARTGFYDELFRIGNTRAWQGKFIYEPTYGYNPNLPKNGPYWVYRYSNFFAD